MLTAPATSAVTKTWNLVHAVVRPPVKDAVMFVGETVMGTPRIDGPVQSTSRKATHPTSLMV